jgi:hypothetical protein
LKLGKSFAKAKYERNRLLRFAKLKAYNIYHVLYMKKSGVAGDFPAIKKIEKELCGGKLWWLPLKDYHGKITLQQENFQTPKTRVLSG